MLFTKYGENVIFVEKIHPLKAEIIKYILPAQLLKHFDIEKISELKEDKSSPNSILEI